MTSRQLHYVIKLSQALSFSQVAEELGFTINILSVLNLGYALVCAALLFGDRKDPLAGFGMDFGTH